jgi:hypothetical protein
MKRLLIVLGLIGVVHISSGLNSSLTLLNPKKEINDNLNAELLSPLTPAFTEIDGNLFLAIQAEEVLNIEDGDVVEFVFGRKSRLISFHINDINQDLIDKGDAQLFVMVHQELALKLKSSRLKEVNIISNKNPYSIQINEFWVPDNYLTSL